MAARCLPRWLRAVLLLTVTVVADHSRQFEEIVVGGLQFRAVEVAQHLGLFARLVCGCVSREAAWSVEGL